MKNINEVETFVDSISSHKKSRRRRGIGIRRRTAFGIFAVLVIVLMLTVSAGLLSYYGTIETTAHVEQSVLVDGNDYNTVIEHKFNVVAGCTEIFKHKILNQACVEAPIGVTTTINGNGNGIEGVNVDYYLMSGWKTLRLENKDASWNVLDGDDFYADVTYNPCCPTFKGTVDLYGTDDITKYALIYYADQQSRFDNWGGDPLTVIATFTGNGVHDFEKELSSCLPVAGDWNIGPDAHYKATDGYVHAKGAKLWIVPFDDISGISGNTVWNQNQYLFETDLIAYFDCDINPIPTYLFPYFNYETLLTVPPQTTLQPGEEICLFIRYNFDVAIIPGLYDITTQIVPT